MSAINTARHGPGGATPAPVPACLLPYAECHAWGSAGLI